MINFAIVGAGAIAKLMATTIKMMNKGGDESVKLYAIASRSLEKAKEFAKEFGIENLRNNPILLQLLFCIFFFLLLTNFSIFIITNFYSKMQPFFQVKPSQFL